MLHGIPYFYIGDINIVGLSIPTILLAIILGKTLHFFILLRETSRLDLFYSATIFLFVLDFAFRFPFSHFLFLISRTLFHNGQFETGRYGMVYFGTFIAIFPAVYITCVLFRDRANFYKYLDISFLSHTASMIILRIGTALNHYHIGKPTDIAWGIDFGSGQIRHETSFYEIASYSIITILAFGLRKKITTPGILSLIIIAWISLSRFVIDFFRTSEMGVTSKLNFGISPNQLIFLCFFIASSFLLFRYRGLFLKKRYNKKH